MPYIRFKGRAYNVTTQTMIESSPVLYSFFRYTGPTFTVTGPTALSDVDWNAYGEGEVGTNVGTRIEFYAKEFYYNSALTQWPVIRILTTNDVDDYYIEFDHSNPHFLAVKAGGAKQPNMIPFLWSDDIDIRPGGTPILNTLYPRLFTCVRDKEDLLNTVNFFGTFAPVDDPEPFWATYVTNDQYVISSELDIVRYDAGNMLVTYHNPGEVTYTKREDGIGLFYAWRIRATDNEYSVIGISLLASDSEFMRGYNGLYNYTVNQPSIQQRFTWKGLRWGICYGTTSYSNSFVRNVQSVDTTLPILVLTPGYPLYAQGIINNFMEPYVNIDSETNLIYAYLSGIYTPPEPPTDVDPEDIPPADEEPEPIPPDDIDPYYDPTSDPINPQYDPTKDPDNPQYDPMEPHTPFRPPSGPSDPPVQQEQPPVDPIPTPVTPPSYVTTNAMFTLYNPSGGDLTNLANFLWSPTWSIDTFKKIFANPLDCILGLMVMPHLSATVATKTMNVGNISTGVTMHYFTSQFYDFDCGTFELKEYYNSYLDYAPYTKVDIFLPYIGDKQLSTDEVMNKTLGVKYRFDLATGDCVAFITVDGTVLYQFSGNCAARLPLAGNNWNGIIPAITGVAISAGSMTAGLPALGAASAAAVSTMKETISHTGGLSGSAGLMGVQTPYLIVTRPRQALPLSQNSFTGYPSFITESLGSLRGYTEVEQCHLEHVPATGAELEEIERLLKEGVLF